MICPDCLQLSQQHPNDFPSRRPPERNRKKGDIFWNGDGEEATLGRCMVGKGVMWAMNGGKVNIIFNVLILLEPLDVSLAPVPLFHPGTRG